MLIFSSDSSGSATLKGALRATTSSKLIMTGVVCVFCEFPLLRFWHAIKSSQAKLCGLFFLDVHFCVSGMLLNQASPNSCKHKLALAFVLDLFSDGVRSLRSGIPNKFGESLEGFQRVRRKACQPQGW